MKENPNSFKAYNDLSIIYIMLMKDCEQGIKHLKKYQEVANREDFDAVQFNFLMNKCIEKPIM